MTHHVMNHMVKHVGPRLRKGEHVDEFLTNLDTRPRVDTTRENRGFDVHGYPQGMKGMPMADEFMKTIWSRREVQGMRTTAMMSVKGLMTTLRVLPDDLYERVMSSGESIPKGSIFEEIVKRYGDRASYQKAPMMHGS